MSLQLCVLICLMVVQQCVGDQPVEEVITTKKVHLLGGWHDKNPDSEDVKEAAQHAVETFNTHSKGKRVFKLVSVTSARSQVTNVIKFEIDAVLAKTKCLKSENHDLNSCSLGRKRLNCHFKMHFDPRYSKYELQSQRCNKLTENV